MTGNIDLDEIRFFLSIRALSMAENVHHIGANKRE